MVHILCYYALIKKLLVDKNFQLGVELLTVFLYVCHHKSRLSYEAFKNLGLLRNI